MEPILRRANGAAIEKSDAGGTITAILSTSDVDRYGDVIEASGWVLSNYAKNPCLLWSHDRSLPAIGTCENVRIEGNALKGELKFSKASDFAKQIEAGVRDGTVRAISVGFSPIEYGPRKDAEHEYGLQFIKQELLEVSVVNVPANASCVVESKEFRDQLVQKAFGAPRTAHAVSCEVQVDDSAIDRATAKATRLAEVMERLKAASKDDDEEETDQDEPDAHEKLVKMAEKCVSRCHKMMAAAHSLTEHAHKMKASAQPGNGPPAGTPATDDDKTAPPVRQTYDPALLAAAVKQTLGERKD